MNRGYLLDTNALIWWLFRAELLSHHSFEAISDGSMDIFVSPVSAMEIATKVRIRKLSSAEKIAGRFVEVVEAENFKPLPLTAAHADLAGSIKSPHADPWDRLLAAQAQIERLNLITNDRKMESLGVKPYW